MLHSQQPIIVTFGSVSFNWVNVLVKSVHYIVRNSQRNMKRNRERNMYLFHLVSTQKIVYNRLFVKNKATVKNTFFLQ